jgi:hypothetical protein
LDKPSILIQEAHLRTVPPTVLPCALILFGFAAGAASAQEPAESADEPEAATSEGDAEAPSADVPEDAAESPDTPEETAESTESHEAVVIRRTADDERPVPEYDGRPDETTAGEALLWVPRILVSPLYLITEFVIRRPLGFLVAAAEGADLPALFVDFFTFGGTKSGFVPTAFVEFDMRPSVGLYFFADDFIADGNDFRIHAAIGGVDWLRLTVGDRVHLVRDFSSLLFRFEASARPDNLYHGLGPETLEDDRSRYGETRFEGRIEYDQRFEGPSSINVSSRIRRANYRPEADCCSDPSVAEQVANGVLEPPPGFDDLIAYSTVLAGAVDTRENEEGRSSGTGLRVEARAEHGVDLDGGDSWLNVGGAIGGYLDLTGEERIVSLSLALDAAFSLIGASIPFMGLVTYGGDARLRGFRAERLRGETGAVLTLGYTWPIWAFLDGRIELAVGNVFGPDFAGFSLDHMRASASIGFTTIGARDHGFSFLVGGGTEVFENGLEVTSFRLLLGTTRGF